MYPNIANKSSSSSPASATALAFIETFSKSWFMLKPVMAQEHKSCNTKEPLQWATIWVLSPHLYLGLPSTVSNCLTAQHEVKMQCAQVAAMSGISIESCKTP
eukprot:2275273-Amphidinium_carterae.1